MWTESLRRFRGHGNCLTASCPGAISRIVSRKLMREMNASQYLASPDYIVFTTSDRSDVTNGVQYTASGRIHGVNFEDRLEFVCTEFLRIGSSCTRHGKILAKRSADCKEEIRVKSVFAISRRNSISTYEKRTTKILQRARFQWDCLFFFSSFLFSRANRIREWNAANAALWSVDEKKFVFSSPVFFLKWDIWPLMTLVSELFLFCSILFCSDSTFRVLMRNYSACVTQREDPFLLNFYLLVERIEITAMKQSGERGPCVISLAS